MNLSASLFSPITYYGFNLLFLFLLALSIYFIHWHTLVRDTKLQHRLGLALVVVCTIWTLRAGISDGLGIHFFMVTTIHLMFGWQLAIWIIAFALMGMVWIGKESLISVGMNAIISGVIPMLCNYTLWYLHERKKNTNPFTFIFLVAFFGAILSVLFAGLAMTLLLIGSNVYSLDYIVEQFWIYFPLIALPEATVNGLIISGLVFFRPGWLRLFDEEKYFK